MTNFTRGQKGKLADLGLNGPFQVTLEIASGAMETDVSCFGLDAGGKLSDDRYMVFFNQKNAPDNAVTLDLNGARSVFQVDLARLPASIDKLVFTAAADQGAMRSLGPSSLQLGQAAQFAFFGSDFQDEKAVIVGELYRRDGSWRFGAVGQGFAGGLGALLKHFGGSEAAQSPAPVPAAEAPKISLSKIRLEKRGDKISLDKRDSQGYGRIRVNLNWNQGPAPAQQQDSGGFLGKLFSKPSSPANGIDLDIGCLFEMSNGAKSAVQALGNSWGAYERPPYIHLEGDDRTGNVSDGENIFINGVHFDQIQRVLVYAFIYDGVPNWAATDGVVTIDIPGQPSVEVRMDSDSKLSMCAIAMLENHGGNLQVTKLVEYFGGQGKITAHQAMDQRYGFGLNWTAGRKD
ncbi:TerD family protein [Janthinobacterium agaricidamnosum]|uniref:Bacterial stress family protein n=1 Tax=Janthinobacterium agaricidamnosum NBRC 102515 = DSM 9628 TaxID=1349767 RepID=W0VB52_9BURK|nr:TerD family protein [Janthinobacterium agaricidamnosum]CDG84487.1 bacterial stress family protein [Janthinobacterium agaricidamnosum NBRC 102515 = DSM 9628]